MKLQKKISCSLNQIQHCNDDEFPHDPVHFFIRNQCQTKSILLEL